MTRNRQYKTKKKDFCTSVYIHIWRNTLPSYTEGSIFFCTISFPQEMLLFLPPLESYSVKSGPSGVSKGSLADTTNLLIQHTVWWLLGHNDWEAKTSISNTLLKVEWPGEFEILPIIFPLWVLDLKESNEGRGRSRGMHWEWTEAETVSSWIRKFSFFFS